MNTNIVYSVVSDDSDIYLEQAYISIVSLRKRNQQSNVVLVTDSTTNETLSGNRSKILDYIDVKIVVDVPEQFYSKALKSRYLKTTLRKYVNGDYLFIDADTVIADDLSEIDLIRDKCEIAAVFDRHISLSLNNHIKWDKAKHAGWQIKESDVNYFNSGVMFVADTKLTHEFYDNWHSNWLESMKNGVLFDQFSMAKTNQEMGYPIGCLDGIWNCQIASNALKYLCESKIIHYFSSNIGLKERAYVLSNSEVFGVFKKSWELDELLLYVLDKPRSSFKEMNQISTGEELLFLSSSFHVLWMFHRNIYNFLDRVLGILLH